MDTKAMDGQERRKSDFQKKARLWVHPNISQLMQGRAGTRAFDPVVETYREALLDRSTAEERPRSQDASASKAGLQLIRKPKRRKAS